MHQKFKKKIFFFCLTSTIALGIYQYNNKKTSCNAISSIHKNHCTPIPKISLAKSTAIGPDETYTTKKIDDNINFVDAASKATPAVVHITSIYESKIIKKKAPKNPFNEFFKDFFGEKFFGEEHQQEYEYKTKPGSAFGSGVIIHQDGYIITNNHVIQNADKIKVTLDDNQEFDATIVGKDANTDLALLKINKKNLPYLHFGDSEKLCVGEWVLAVGNPFGLTSTVTAGIVSAKSRAINDFDAKDNKKKILSFIQTDAAVNRGNSGGALVNIQGELIGINTAIYAPNMSSTFAGYSFAIPSSIVKKVTQDLMQYGTVQRGVLGIYIQEINAEFAKKKKLQHYSGVYIADFFKDSNAKKAGLKKEDIIIALDDMPIKTVSQLQEKIQMHQPGDKVKIKVLRKGKKKTIIVTLQNDSKVKVKYIHPTKIEIEGATLVNIKEQEKKKMKLQGGVKIVKIGPGKFKQSGIGVGFIITHVNKNFVKNTKTLTQIFDTEKGGLLIEGVYPNGKQGYYALALH